MSTEPSSDSSQTNASNIEVDAGWKAEAQAEKERLVAAEEKIDQKAAQRQIPEANFRGLLGILASQALMGLGMHQDPSGNGVMIDLEGSKFAIDLLALLEEKTKGNITDEESTELKQLTQELQNRFVQIAELVAAQTKEGTVTSAGPSAGSTGATGGIIDPTA